MNKKIVKNIGFVRAFSDEEDMDKDKLEILELAHKKQLGKVQFIEDIFSRKTPWSKRKIADVAGRLGRGDNLIVCDFARLGHTTRECLEILSMIIQKGVNVYSVKHNCHFEENTQREAAAKAFSMALEIDRYLSSKRTKEALRVKKASGASLGRPRGPGKSKLDPYKLEIKTLLKNGSTKAFIADRFTTTPANLSNWMRKHGITRTNLKGDCEKKQHTN